MLNIKKVLASAPKKPENVELQLLDTPWSEHAASCLGTDASVAPHDPKDRHAAGQQPLDGLAKSSHPHPQFERAQFQSLNGWWDYRIVPSDEAGTTWRNAPSPMEWDGQIRVPFSPEAPLSGVGRQLKPNELLWYRRSFPYPSEFLVDDEAPGGIAQEASRCILHFEAVDYACACYCNGSAVGTHVGGYLPFSFDITDALAPGENELVLCVYDPSDAGVQLRGKQRLERGGIWYTAQSGIWQTVWLEVVPKRHIASLAIDAQADTGRLELTVALCNGMDAHETPWHRTPLTVKLYDGDRLVGTASSGTDRDSVSRAEPYLVADAEEGRLTVGSDPSDSKQLTTRHTLVLTVSNPHLWSPADPHLYDIELTFGRDRVTSYCAFRTVTIEEDGQGVSRLCINHEPCFLRGVLDQGYWPDGLMTAPSDNALVFDIQTCKDLGFNMLRKHIKIEADRWYYHCDRLGMLVWQDMVCGGSTPKPWHTSYKPTFFRWAWSRYSDASQNHRNLSAEDEAFRAEWTQACKETIDYLGNHPSIITWVLFNEAWGQFDARAATEMVRRLDPTRPIDAVSGWYDQACGDFLSVHNYFRPLEVYKDQAHLTRAFVISEFGGLTFHLPGHSALASSYGYETFSDIASYRAAVLDTLARADSLEHQGLAGFVYTQLADVEEETNGLLTYDRRINKLDDKDCT